MNLKRRHLLSLPLLPAVGVVWANEPPRMRRTPGERAQVHVGAGTQGDATTGSSGPQKKESGDGAAAGSVSSSQPGGGSGGSGSRR